MRLYKHRSSFTIPYSTVRYIIYMYTCIYVYIHTYICIYVYMYVCIYVLNSGDCVSHICEKACVTFVVIWRLMVPKAIFSREFVCVCMCVCKNQCVCVCAWIHVCVYVCARMNQCVCVCMCVCINQCAHVYVHVCA